MQMKLLNGSGRNGRGRPSKCPCLYDEGAPICRADCEALRVPTQQQLSTLCTSGEHRRCLLYRRFLKSTLVPLKDRQG